MILTKVLITLLVLVGLAQVAVGGGKAKILFVRYNGDGNGSNGHCCDGKWIFCAGACEHQFTICVGHAMSDSSFSDCAFYSGKTTSYEQDSNQNSFTSHIGGISNPITFNVDSFERGIRLKIQVTDVDSANAHDHVDDLNRLIEVRADRKEALATYKDLVITSRTSMTLRYMAYCDPDYYTPYCNVHCQARDDSQGHYLCDPSTGSKICHAGWTGPNCDQDVDECVNNPCLNGGSCTNSMGSFSCQCTPAYAGPRCEVDFRSCDSNPCKNGATCLNLNLTHVCQCTSAWTGTLCETEVTLCHSLPCLNSGNCTGNRTDYSCSCQDEWRGQNCSISTVVDFTGDPSSVLLEGNITNEIRDDLHEGLKGLIHHTLSVPSATRVFVKETVLIRTEWRPTVVTEVQFIGAINLGHDVFNKTDTDFSLKNETVVESYLPLPLFHPPPRQEGQEDDNVAAAAAASTQSWGASNWYIPFAVVLVIAIVAAIIGFLLLTRRRKEKQRRLQEPTISVEETGNSNMAFENILYSNAATNRPQSDVIAAEQNAQNEANSCTVPVEYSTPVTHAPPPPVLEGAVGGAEGGYQEIDPAKLKAKDLEADKGNPNLNCTNTKTDYLRPCLNMGGNDYQDFSNISGRHEQSTAGRMPVEENPYMEVGQPIRLGRDYMVDERAFNHLFDSDDDDDDILKKPAASSPGPELPARNASMSSSSTSQDGEKKEVADEWSTPDWEKLRDELMAEKQTQA